jgi:hypothetical protein
MWTYQNNQSFEMPDNALGYIYCITNKLDNKIYIGRKLLVSNRKKTLTKKEKLLPENKRKKFKREIKETDWKNYWGSSDELKRDIEQRGQENFSREILMFCSTLTDVSFYETYFQIKYDVLFCNSYNRHIANTKFFKGKVNKL